MTVARPAWGMAMLVATGVVLHALLAASIGLSPDEAHYALYGAHPDWSYFDHPPLAGWLQAPFVAMGGADVLMRLVPMACWLATAGLSVALCRRLTSSASGNAWVVALLLLSPLLDLLGVALVPDTLLMPLVPAMMAATWSLRGPAAARRLDRWAVLSALAMLCLLAKYTGVFVIAGAVATLARFHGRDLLRLRGARLLLVAIALGAAPVVAWNAARGWASFAYQAGHAVGAADWRVVPMLRAVLLQPLMFGLLLPVGVVVALRRGVDRDVRAMALSFGVPVLLVFVVQAGFGSSLPHWPTCGCMALLPLAVVGCERLSRRAAIGLLVWQAAFLAALLVIVEAAGFQSEQGAAALSAAGVKVPGAPLNPVADLYGWQAAAEHGAGIAERKQARGLVVGNWSLAGRLAWYARPLPVFVAPAHVDQFRLWFGALRAGDSAIVVDWSRMPLPVPVGPGAFAHCEAVDQLAIVERGRQVAHFDYLFCRGWGGGAAAR